MVYLGTPSQQWMLLDSPSFFTKEKILTTCRQAVMLSISTSFEWLIRYNTFLAIHNIQISEHNVHISFTFTCH